ncbi:MAG TPA: cytochrome c [Terriglobales bacterium]|nr:cytochrome c [Terriglobales bacterium]
MKSRIAIALVVACAFSGVFGAGRGLQPRLFAQDEQQAAESQSVWDGVYTEEQARRGEALYQKDCSTCHGDRLNGTGEAPALSGGGFLSNWNGLTVGDLFERIRKTMPQDKPGRLTRQEKADVLAYILSFNKFPAGKSELRHQSEWLKQIQFEESKPEREKPSQP